MPYKKRIRIAKETLEIYAPLSGRMGIQALREELEELSFKVINPKAQKIILDKLKSISSNSSKLINGIKDVLLDEISKNDILCSIDGWEKKPYSIWQKMRMKNVSFEQLSDIMAFRIIVPNDIDCYKALGCIHQIYLLQFAFRHTQVKIHWVLFFEFLRFFINMYSDKILP